MDLSSACIRGTSGKKYIAQTPVRKRRALKKRFEMNPVHEKPKLYKGVHDWREKRNQIGDVERGGESPAKKNCQGGGASLCEGGRGLKGGSGKGQTERTR